MKKNFIGRIYFLNAVFIVLAMLFAYRLYTIQIRNHETWVARGEANYVQVEKGIFKRGSIYVTPRIGDPLPAATTQSGYILAVDYRELKNHVDAYTQLQGIVPTLDREQFFSYATGRLGWRELERRLTEDAAQQILALKLTGIHLVKTQWRVYPYGSVMARTIGFVGASDQDAVLSGRYGVEKAYDENLQRPSTKQNMNLFAELFADLRATSTNIAEAADLYTTIEPTVAHLLQNTLRSVHEKYQSEITGGIIMNPKTGEIYAMDAVPTYDSNNRQGVALETLMDPNVLATYEFGSIMKPLTVASGIDAGVIGRYTTYLDTGCTTLSTLKICNYDGVARGTTEIQQVLSQSLNMGVVYIQQLLGKDRFRTYFENLKLGSATGIDAGGEVSGDIRNLQQKYDINYATASYGQGIATTPIAMIRALATLANEGVLPAPRIGSKLRYVNGNEASITFPAGERVFSKETTDTVSSMLTEVTDNALLRGKLKIEGYSVAAKTGTSFLVDGNGGYDKERYFHSLFGYFPAHDPKFIILLYTRDPKGVQYASETLADTYMGLVRELISYYEIPPDR